MKMQRRIYEFESGEEIIDPSWSDVKGFLDDVDGQRETYGALYVTEVGRLVVGGGQEGKWLVYFEPESDDGDGPFPTLVDRALGDETVKIVICGAYSEYPAYKCVGKDKVLLAFERFYNSGTLAEELEWVTD